jgi:hypothetical protein
MRPSVVGPPDDRCFTLREPREDRDSNLQLQGLVRTGGGCADKRGKR